VSYSVGKSIQVIRQALLAKRKAGSKAWSQESVAHDAGISLRHYQKIEAGEIDIRISTLFAIAKVLKVPPQVVLDRADELARKKR
jgi:transcriptional regulator with XRE-family HTH domain